MRFYVFSILFCMCCHLGFSMNTWCVRLFVGIFLIMYVWQNMCECASVSVCVNVCVCACTKFASVITVTPTNFDSKENINYWLLLKAFNTKPFSNLCFIVPIKVPIFCVFIYFHQLSVFSFTICNYNSCEKLWVSIFLKNYYFSFYLIQFQYFSRVFLVSGLAGSPVFYFLLQDLEILKDRCNKCVNMRREFVE